MMGYTLWQWLTQLWKIAIYSWFFHWKWWFSIILKLNYQRETVKWNDTLCLFDGLPWKSWPIEINNLPIKNLKTSIIIDFPMAILDNQILNEMTRIYEYVCIYIYISVSVCVCIYIYKSNTGLHGLWPNGNIMWQLIEISDFS